MTAHLEIDGHTTLVGLIGHDFHYTLSPAIHNAAFRELGMNWVYVPLPVRPGALVDALRGLKAMGFRGANVTIPHKIEAAMVVDELCGDARLLGAVNTLVVEDDGLRGYNTDVEGFRLFLEEKGILVRGSAALVLGAGGAARAVALALAREGLARLHILNRTVARAVELQELLKGVFPSTEISVGKLDPEGSGVLWECDLAVNCTPLGRAKGEDLPVDYGAFRRGKWAVDLAYGAERSQFLARAEERGAQVADGEGMLIHQAAASFRLWTGRPAPLEAMRSAYRRAIGAEG